MVCISEDEVIVSGPIESCVVFYNREWNESQVR